MHWRLQIIGVCDLHLSCVPVGLIDLSVFRDPSKSAMRSDIVRRPSLVSPTRFPGSLRKCASICITHVCRLCESFRREHSQDTVRFYDINSEWSRRITEEGISLPETFSLRSRGSPSSSQARELWAGIR